MIDFDKFAHPPKLLKREFSSPTALLGLVLIVAFLFLIYIGPLGKLSGFFARKEAEQPSFAIEPPFPAGLSLLAHPQDLPQLRPQVFAKQVSSHDKTGGNMDGGYEPDYGLGSYHYKESGKYVLFDENGPGTITRIWFSWPEGDQVANGHLQFYFDNEGNPRINLTLAELFSGQRDPFVKPLVNDANTSSGGYVSYLPIPFAKSLKITLDQPPGFYQIGFEKYDHSVKITSFTNKVDVSQIQNQWQNLGVDPKQTFGNISTAGKVSILAGQKATIFEKNSAGAINAIKFRIPQIRPAVVQNALSDNGRAHRQSSRFIAKIDPNNQEIKLVRRMDFATGNQKAEVLVDGQLVGEWFTPDNDLIYRWRDSSFEIPVQFSTNKERLTIQINFISSDNDWNEFHYWVYSKVGNKEILTDEINIGNLESESNHSYQISSQNFVGTTDIFYYPKDKETQSHKLSRQLLSKVRIKANWDKEATPSVDVPIGGFFGSIFAEVESKSLLFGMTTEESGYYYNYYPMPFNQNAKIEIVNQSSIDIERLDYEIVYSNNSDPGLGQTVGYFNAKFNQQTEVLAANGYQIGQIKGSGQLLGVMLFSDCKQVTSGINLDLRNCLKGDERFYFDGSNHPDIYGTGTDNYFNGGFHFDRGLYSGPLSGFNFHKLNLTDPNKYNQLGMYRLYLADAIPFRNGVDLTIEHASQTNYYSVVFWYGLDSSATVLTDEVDFGNIISETEHSYRTFSDSSINLSRYQYESANGKIDVIDNRRTTANRFSFQIKVLENQPIILRRRFDHGIANQKAQVYADGKFVGTWYSAGRNIAKRWKDDYFLIPKEYTTNKGIVTIGIKPAQSLWDMSYIWVYSFK